MAEFSSAVQQPLAASNGDEEGWKVVHHARHKQQQQHTADPVQPRASLPGSTTNGSAAAAAQRRLMSEAHKSHVDPINGRIRCRACGKAFSAYSFLAQHLKQRHFGLNSDDATALEYQYMRRQQQGRTHHPSSNVPLTAADFPSLSATTSPAEVAARPGATHPALSRSCWQTPVDHPVEMDSSTMADACSHQQALRCAPVTTATTSATARDQSPDAGARSSAARGAKAHVSLQHTSTTTGVATTSGQSSRNNKPRPSASHTLDLGHLIELTNSNSRKHQQQQQRRPPHKQRPQDKKQRLTADQVRLILAAAAEQGLKVKKGAAELKRNSRGKLSRLKRLIICERADRQLAAAGHALKSSRAETKVLEQQLQALEHRLEAAQQLQQLLAQSGGDSSSTPALPGSDLAGDTTSSTPGASVCCPTPCEPSNTVAAAGSCPPRCDPQTAARVSVAALQLAVQRAASALSQAQKVVDKHQAEKQAAQAVWNRAYKVKEQEDCEPLDEGKVPSSGIGERLDASTSAISALSQQADGKAGTSEEAAFAEEADSARPTASAAEESAETAELPDWLGQLGSESESDASSDIASISSGDDSEDTDGMSSDGEDLVGFVDVLSKWAANMPQQQLAKAFKSARRSDARAAGGVQASPSSQDNTQQPLTAGAGGDDGDGGDGDGAAGRSAEGSQVTAESQQPPGLGNSGSDIHESAAAAAQMPLAPAQPCSLVDEAESSSGCDSSDEEGEGPAPTGPVLAPLNKPQLVAPHGTTMSLQAASGASTSQQAPSKLLSDSAESNAVTTPANTGHALNHSTGSMVTAAAASTPSPAVAAVGTWGHANSSSESDQSAPSHELQLPREQQHRGPLGRLQVQVPSVTQTSSTSSTPYQQQDNDLQRPNLSVAASPSQQKQLAALSPLRMPTQQPPPPPPPPPLPKQQQVARNLSSSRSIGAALDPVHPAPPTPAVAGGFGSRSRAVTEQRQGASTTSSDSARSGGLVNSYLDRTASGNSSVTSRCVLDAAGFRKQANETVPPAMHGDLHHSAAGHDAHAASLAALQQQQQQQQQLLQLQVLQQQQQQVVPSLQAYPGYAGVSRMSSTSRAPDSSVSSAALAAGALHLGQAAPGFSHLNGAVLPLDTLDSSGSLASAAVAAMAGLAGTSPISTLYAGSSIAGGSLTGGSPFGGSPFGGSPMGGSPLGGSPSHIAFSAGAAAGHVSTSAAMLGGLQLQQFPGHQQQQLLLEASMLPDRTMMHPLANGLGYGLPAAQQQQQQPGAEDDQVMALQLAAAVAAQHSDPTTAAAAAAAAMVSFRQQQEQQQLQEFQRQQQLLLAVEQMLLTCGHTLDSTTSNIISTAIAQGDVHADTLHQLLSQLLSGSSAAVPPGTGMIPHTGAQSCLPGPERYACWPQVGDMYSPASGPGAGVLPGVSQHALGSSNLDCSGFNSANNLVASPQPSQRSIDGASRGVLASPGQHTGPHQPHQQLMLQLQPPPPPPLARGGDSGVTAMLQRHQPPPPPLPSPQQQQQQLGNVFTCSLCQVSCNSMQTLQQHLESKRHIAKAAYATLAAVQQPGQALQQNTGASLLMAAGSAAGSSPESASLLDQCMNPAVPSAVAAAAASLLLAEGAPQEELLSGLGQAFSPSAPALGRIQSDLRNSNISSASTNSFSAGSLLPFPALTLGGGSSSSGSIIGHPLRGRSPSGRSPTAMSPTGFNRGPRGISPQGGSRGASPRGGSRGASPGGSPHAVTYVGPHAAVQAYCTQEITPELNAAVTTLLTSVKGQQDKAIAKSPGKAALKRCYVCGLREVCKAIKGGKAVAVLLAPNIESNEAEGGLNDSIQDIITACTAADIPVVFALSRKKMGEVYGFRKRMSAIALLEVSAVQGALNQVLQLAAEGRRLWAANHPDRLAAAAAAAVVSEVAVALGGAGPLSANASPAVGTDTCVTVS